MRAWLRIAFGGFIAALGVLIASMQWVEASWANERDEARAYREQAFNCFKGIGEFANEALVATTQVGREMAEFDLPIANMTPAYARLDGAFSDLLFCSGDEGVVDDPDGLLGLAGMTASDIGSYWSEMDAPDGTRFTSYDEFLDTVADSYVRIVGEPLSQAWAAYEHGIDWRTKVDEA